MLESFNLVNKSEANIQLILFPFLGGSATSFRPLINQLKKLMDAKIWIANPPGHGGSQLPLVNSMDDLIAFYADGYQQIANEQTVLFGHSMGGMICYHLMNHLILSKADTLLPTCLIMSGCGPGKTLDRNIYSAYSEADLIERLASFGAMPEEIRQSQALQKLFIPLFRSDYRVMESVMNFEPTEKLNTKAYQICGATDRETKLSDSLKWLTYFKRPMTLKIVENGGHMFVNDQALTVAQYIADIVSAENRRLTTTTISKGA